MARPRHPKKKFEFSLILLRVGELTDDIADAVYEADCDDALLGMQCGVLYLDFEREASSLQEAVLKAINQVGSAGLDLHVVRVYSETFDL